MATIIKGEDVIGQPIKGRPDCYKAGPGDKGAAAGSQHYPQGEDGPRFVKSYITDPMTGDNVGVWKHVEGDAGSLDTVLNGVPLRGRR